MSKLPQPLKRPGSANFYVRVYVPANLKAHYPGSGQIWRSLGTPSPAEAKRLAPAALAAIYDEFDRKRRPRAPSDADIQDIAWARYTYMVERDERLRDRTPTEDELNEIWQAIVAKYGDEDYLAYKEFEKLVERRQRYDAARPKLLEALKSPDPNTSTAAVAHHVEREVAARGLDAAKGTSAYRKIASAVQRGQIEALKRAGERDIGEWGGKPSDPLVQPLPASAPRTAAPGDRLMDYFGRFLDQQGAQLKPDTRKQNTQIVKLFAEFVGETKPIENLSKLDVSRWRDKLLLFPTKAQQTSEFRDLKFSAVIAKNDALKRPTLSPKSVNKYLSALAPFVRWLSSNGYIPSLIVVDEMYLAVERGPDKRKRDPFSEEQLKQLFASPLFHQCRGDKAEHLPGNAAIRDWRYWLPLIGLFSGMRLGEIAQLLVDDIRLMHGDWIMRVTTEGDPDKSLKTETSQRIVPVHSRLVALGLLTYHAARQEAGDKRLFPEIKADARGFISGVPSKFLNGYMRDIGVKTDNTAFHSLRHNFADRLRAAGYLDQEFGFILGHGDRFGMTTGRYGQLSQGTLDMRKRLIEAVQYDEIDLNALRYR